MQDCDMTLTTCKGKQFSLDKLKTISTNCGMDKDLAKSFTSKDKICRALQAMVTSMKKAEKGTETKKPEVKEPEVKEPEVKEPEVKEKPEEELGVDDLIKKILGVEERYRKKAEESKDDLISETIADCTL